MTEHAFRFSIDRGGTFTDVYAEVPGKPGFRVVKLLSEDPQNYPDAPREGIRRILEEVTGTPFPKEGFSAEAVEWIRMGTTVATNALLERKGARTALVITQGFQDLLQIGNQTRPKLFDLEIRKLDLLYEQVIEVEERVRLLQKNEAEGRRQEAEGGELEVVEGTTGEPFLVLANPDVEAVRSQLRAVYDSGIRALAVVFTHAYAVPDHERKIGELAREIGFTQISLSHEVMPMVKMVARGDTTTVDAYLTPHIRNYLDSFRAGFSDGLESSQLLFMQSDGGLTGADHFKGSNAILSGPAGGVVGYALTTDLGQPVIGFDMGGTSTDVSRYGTDYELTHETETAGVRIQAPQMHIKTVAAGGGSRLFFRNGLFEVGPESAGAHPGPVCYRKNGHLAITDANLVLGRLHPDYFPKIFGPTEDQPLDADTTRRAFETLADQINTHSRERGLPEMSLEDIALGFIRVANEVMVRPIREISVMRGFDTKEHVLACFGGAGGQHACAIARELGISRIFIHRFAGILSAYGMGLADVVSEQQEPAAAVLPTTNSPLGAASGGADDTPETLLQAIEHGQYLPQQLPPAVDRTQAQATLRTAEALAQRIHRAVQADHVAEYTSLPDSRERFRARRAVFERIKPQEEVALREWAVAEGLMLTGEDCLCQWERDGKLGGTEHQIWLDEQAGRVFKLNNLSFHVCWLEYFHRLALHNHLFPDTQMKLEGFVECDGTLMPVTSQAVIQAVRGATREETQLFMQRLGFAPISGKANDYLHAEQGLIAEDLHDENVLIDIMGSIVILDPVMYLDESSKLERLQRWAAAELPSRQPGNSLKVLAQRLDTLAEQGRDELLAQGHAPEHIEVKRFLNLRYQGTDTALMIPEPEATTYDASLTNCGLGFSNASAELQSSVSLPNFAESFKETYRREFGFELANRDILVDDVRVRAVAKSPGLQKFPIPQKTEPPQSDHHTRCYFEGGWHDTPIFLLEQLGAGQRLNGPAILMQDTSTILIEPGCFAEITEFGDVVITVETRTQREIGTQSDPIQLSIFSNLFMSIAEQMGRTLQRTAISTNIKERLDFSCAIFDESGGLVANAPHVPVHLGAMSDAVRRQIELQGENLREGDVLVSNHPIAGGSHLPDITVITPVWRDGRPIFFVASRGHHADIGGISPGSMPPFSRKLIEEGACIKSFKLVENGVFNEEGITELLLEPGTLPRGPGEASMSGARLLSDNLSDLKAQIAANQRGIDLLLEMVDHYSLDVVQAYMWHIQANAEEAVRHMLTDLSAREGLKEVDSLSAQDFLDDGSPIVLKITIDRRDGSAIFDFTGTGSELWGNLNAPRAVTSSAILYGLRCLIPQDIPLNQGCLNPIQVIVPEGTLLSPSEHAGVVGGNVLTSQRITDVILRAFHACAASQGCTNNFTFGNERFGYYETIGGGAGAGASWHGQSGVHTHMTNTRITDPEILERRFPVMLREFSIRPNTGGNGKFRGGDGLVREVEFLEPLNAAILSERRVYAPYGLDGGEPGVCGRNLFLRNDGTTLSLGGKNEIRAEVGERFRIETPGGGGYGTSDKERNG